MQTIINLDNSPLTKNHIYFKHNEIIYQKNLIGENILDVFNRNLMNTFLNQYENIGNITYDNIISIYVLENRNQIINDLPSNLMHLTIMSSTCNNLIIPNQTKQNIESIIINKSNISSFPNIDGCNNLKQLKITKSNIQSFNIDYNLSTKLLEFSLSGNNIKNTEENIFSYDKLLNILSLNKFMKFNFSDNYLQYDLFPDLLARRCNLIRQFTYKYHIISFRNVAEENIQNFLAMQDEQPLTATSQILSSQSVHLTSINRSVVKSVETIVSYINSNNIPIFKLPDNFIDDNYTIEYIINYIVNIFNINNIISNNINKKMENMLYYFLNKYKTHDFISCLITSLNIETKNSSTGYNYKETFELIFTVICNLIFENKFNKDDLLERLQIEINDSVGMCFTGKYNRLVNSLNGILDGVQIGISKNEEIQMEFESIIKKMNKNGINRITFNKAIEEACEILYDSPEKNIWLNALYDYAPEPEQFEIMYWRTWDDLLFNYDKDCIIGIVENDTVRLFE